MPQMPQAKLLFLSPFSPPSTSSTFNILSQLLSNTKHHSWSHPPLLPHIQLNMSYNFTHEIFFNSNSITNTTTFIQATIMPYVDDYNSMVCNLLALLQFIPHAAGRSIRPWHYLKPQSLFLPITIRILLIVVHLTFSYEWNCIQFNQRCGH